MIRPPFPPFWNFVGNGIHNGPVTPALVFMLRGTRVTSFEKVHTHKGLQSSLVVSFQPSFYGESYHHAHFSSGRNYVGEIRGVLLTTIVTSYECLLITPYSMQRQPPSTKSTLLLGDRWGCFTCLACRNLTKIHPTSEFVASENQKLYIRGRYVNLIALTLRLA